MGGGTPDECRRIQDRGQAGDPWVGPGRGARASGDPLLHGWGGQSEAVVSGSRIGVRWGTHAANGGPGRSTRTVLHTRAAVLRPAGSRIGVKWEVPSLVGFEHHGVLCPLKAHCFCRLSHTDTVPSLLLCSSISGMHVKLCCTQIFRPLTRKNKAHERRKITFSELDAEMRAATMLQIFNLPRNPRTRNTRP